MLRRNDPDHLVAAWRALAEGTPERGWRVIEIARTTICVVQAGRRAPENDEVLLFGIDGAGAVVSAPLPRGQGFTLTRADAVDSSPGRTWLALTRLPGGHLEMFSLMASDLVSLLVESSSSDGTMVYSSVMSRIRAWQDFMKKDRAGVLSAEEELGLCGELLVMQDILESGVPATAAIECWVGPEDGLQDFVPGTGAIEVKTTIAPAGFFADISSLEQLDHSFRSPLHVATVRLKPSSDGWTLPELRDRILESVQKEAGAASLLESRLLSAGYVDANRGQYSRRFVLSELAYRLVDETTPRLTRANVHVAVQRARYTLDLDAFRVVAGSFRDIADDFGVKEAWN